MRSFLIFIFGLFFISSASAQFNMKVGYHFTYSDPTVNNAIIQRLNTNNSGLENYIEMDEVNRFHGILLGARYRFEPVGINADWSSKFQVVEYEGLNPNTGAKQFKKHFYRILSYSAGLEFFISRFSFGGTIDRNTIRIRAENDGRSDRHIIFNDQGWSSHFFISLNIFGNDNLSIALQPFVQIPWTKFNLTRLESGLDTGVDLEDFEEGFQSYGFRIIFQNGNYDN